MSTDETPNIIKGYEQKYPFIRLIPNPERIVPAAFNAGVEASKGDFVIIWGAHSSYQKNYVSALVNAITELDADLVGGCLETRPRNDSLIAKAIALALSNPFGIGNASFRLGTKEAIETDTVPFGCYRRSTFEKTGLYDIKLVRNQDMEMSKRILKHGGKIYLVPEVTSVYYCRSTYPSLWENNFNNGKWVILTTYFTKTLSSLSVRHFIPLGFFLYLISLPFWAYFSMIFLVPLVLYFLLMSLVATKISFAEKNIVLFPFLILAFLCLHLSYGMGSLKGITRIFTDR